jgi:hypothetical protein
MTTNIEISKEFTYNCPDKQYATNSNMSITGTYAGVSKWYVFIDDTNHLSLRAVKYTDADGGAEVLAPEGHTKVLIDASIDPFMAAIIDPAGFQLVTPVTTVSEIITLADANATEMTHSYEWPPVPRDLIDDDSIVYNAETASWTYDFKDSSTTWGSILQTRNSMLENSDSKIADDMPEALKASWVAYRKQLRDLPSDWAGVDPHKVVYPTEPGNN